MQNNPLSLAVVGHTNTGKTSLLRTLLRDGAFGEVADAPSTTRHVERSAVSDGPDTLVYLYDTPGLEDAGGLLDWLESHTPSRSDGIERLQLFLDSPEAAADFNQEAKVLRQLLQSDMALYVVDAREPVLNKYKDELTVLSWCAKPVMPVFNFVGGQDLSAWTTMLARRNLHVYSGFDTVAFDFEGEIRLWDNLATMLPERTVLDRLTAMRRREWHQLDGEAKREIAGFLLDVAAYRQETEADGASDGILQTMQAEVRQLERQLQQRLLQIYRFYQSGVDTAEWALKAFRQDPFDRDLLVQYGIRTGTGAATGGAYRHGGRYGYARRLARFGSGHWRHHWRRTAERAGYFRQNQRSADIAYRCGNHHPSGRPRNGLARCIAKTRPCGANARAVAEKQPDAVAALCDAV